MFKRVEDNKGLNKSGACTNPDHFGKGTNLTPGTYVHKCNGCGHQERITIPEKFSK